MAGTRTPTEEELKYQRKYRPKGSGRRVNIVEPPEDEGLEDIKGVDEMSKGGIINMTKDKKYYKGIL